MRVNITRPGEEVDINHKIRAARRIKVNITCGFLLLLIAATVLAGPGRTGLLLVAAAVHELGHIAALRCFGARVERFSLGGGGAELSFSGTLSYPAEIAAALSGPLAGAMLSGAALWAGRRLGSGLWLELAAVSALYTAVNLVPAGASDGGRALEAALSMALGPDRAYFIGLLVDGLCAALALAGGIWSLFCTGGCPFGLIYAVFLLNGCCKRRGFGVQSS